MSQIESFRAMRRAGWGTDDETEFLHGIGSHCADVEIPRIDLLRRYATALSKRARWGGISYHLIASEVSRQIRIEELRLERRGARK